MSELKRCETCRGTKTILSLGNLRKECSNCDGIGWTEDYVEKPVITIKKKPGRKPKVKTDVLQVGV